MPYTTHVRFDELFDECMDYPASAGGGESAPLPQGGLESVPPGGEGRPGRRGFPTGGGVYLLTDAQDRLIQLAAAADLKRALINRLTGGKSPDEAASEGLEQGSFLVSDGEKADKMPAPPEQAGEVSAPPEQAGKMSAASERVGKMPAALRGRPRANLGEIVRRIRWRPTHSMFEITVEYHRLARLLMPDTYLKQVGFGPCWFVHVDPAAAIPGFQAGKWLRSPPGVDLGPFAIQGDAGRFIEILEDAFDLCRYYHILQQVPRGQPCAYFDMGKCPAPCYGSISMDAYRDMIGRALAFAYGDRRGAYAGWEEAMRAAAGARAYERAGAIKQLIDRARRIEHESFRLARPIERFRYLIIQRGGGTTQVKPFFVRAGHLQSGPAVRLKELETAVPGWLEQMNADPPGDADAALRSERIWLVSHFLFKRETPGLFIPAESAGEPAGLVERIREHFASRRKEELRDLGGDAVAEGGKVRR